MYNQGPLSEREIRQLFVESPNPKSAPIFQYSDTTESSPSKIGAYFRYTIMCLAMLFLIFGVVNFPSLYQQIKYWWKVDYRGGTISDPNLFGPITQPGANLAQPEEESGTEGTTASAGQIDLTQSKLYIPKINVAVPIIWDVPQEKILDKLKEGVAQYQGTAYPGQIGNVFITGHSSNYWWIKGNYNQVFALLDKLVVGDEIYLTYQSIIYKYRVSSSLVVNPDDIQVMESQGKSTLSLMTCVPVGTTLQRLVVRADLVSPTVGAAATSGHNTQEDLIQELLQLIKE